MEAGDEARDVRNEFRSRMCRENLVPPPTETTEGLARSGDEKGSPRMGNGTPDGGCLVRSKVGEMSWRKRLL
jgi:hypothetical protein